MKSTDRIGNVTYASINMDLADAFEKLLEGSKRGGLRTKFSDAEMALLKDDIRRKREPKEGE